jgi:tRNA dimethylallyltransferase
MITFLLMEEKPKILVVVGPTATGKSDLAVQLAKTFNGEVVSADSRQVYAGLDIGTGKVTAKEMAGIPHHMLSVVPPETIYSVSEYRDAAEKAITEILARGKLPIVCGGTGFYIQALVDGIQLPDVPPNPELRESLASFTTPALFEKLLLLDPDFASIVDKHNPHRLIRAIEIASVLGRVPALLRNPLYDPCFIGITCDLYTLRDRIHARLLARIDAGMVAEAMRLHDGGLTYERMELLGLEYRYLARHLKGNLSLDEMTLELEGEIMQYAKRQLTWFKRDDRIRWFEKENISAIEAAIRAHLGTKTEQ